MNTTLVAFGYTISGLRNTFSLLDDGEFEVCQMNAHDKPSVEFTGSVLSPVELEVLLRDLKPFVPSLVTTLAEQLQAISDEWREAVALSKSAQQDEIVWTADLHTLRCKNAYRAVQTLLERIKTPY